MSSRIQEFETRLNPIIAAEMTAREQELIKAVREVTDGAMKAGQYGSIRMCLGLEAVYRDELTRRGVLIWEMAMNAVDGLRPFKPMELADDFKHFVSDHLEASRSALARELKERSGKRGREDETLNQRFEMCELREDLLRSYGAKIDLWALQQQREMKDAATQRVSATIQRVLDWIWRFIRVGIGK